MSRTAEENPYICTSCQSSNVMIMQKWRYLFLTSMLPVLVVLAVSIFIEPLFLLFIPAVLVTNYIISARKTPMVMCRDCRHIEKGASLPQR
ncbi:MAG: hypothetical protein EA344_12070 [Alkalicoccus sp.]|nr:MAG: hypothetical protein EA344_12070 [Alkalicoccus sp.]